MCLSATHHARPRSRCTAACLWCCCSANDVPVVLLLPPPPLSAARGRRSELWRRRLWRRCACCVHAVGQARVAAAALAASCSWRPSRFSHCAGHVGGTVMRSSASMSLSRALPGPCTRGVAVCGIGRPALGTRAPQRPRGDSGTPAPPPAGAPATPQHPLASSPLQQRC